MISRWKLAASAVLFLFCAGLIWLAYAPPDLIRVGANYSAKIICSNVFLAGRDANEVLALDVQAPGHPLLKLMRVQVDREHGLVSANILGFIGDGLAVFRPGTGCAAVPDGDVALARKYQMKVAALPLPSANAAWPVGSKAEVNEKVENIISQEVLNGPGMRGIAVIHQGKLIAQRYGAGFDEHTPLIGWSMTKTVNAALIGIQVGEGKLRLNQDGFWRTATPSDGREKIKLADLLAMSSGLHFDEEYGDVSDVTRMLYLEPDMATFVHDQALEHPAGSVWNYSSGTSVLLAQIWQQVAGADALRFPQQRLFAPLGMTSALLEADARGNLVGASYLYATAQDWARFGQLLLQDGVWNGRHLLPEGYVKMMLSAVPASKGKYGQGQIWLEGPGPDTPEGKSPDTPFMLPKDTYWMQGHDGQTIAIIPSKQLVVVRLGLTPRKFMYMPQAMLAEIIKATD
ncbi:serine hydrolase domain-containing protein [Solimicrobium silvestre]|uniref:Beta-lactamase class C and other penicillin binding protein n=1 Tax=Solimicrobium silvestre TaxID=2099400 RepID=A0A2S9GVW7_9BURK|nr:serine hydrolase [Solimicrobium silvestre]PRC91867.1 Beta-lactamase class C and other penicillin binding protein [Solimicrobium silvestre]